MAKYTILEVSDEVISILRRGGRRCENFLENVKDNQKAITVFCRHYGVRLRGVDVGTESKKEEPFYTFSDGLGSYNIRGLRLELA